MRLSFKGCSGMCLTNDDIRTSYVKKEVKVDGKTVSQYELAKDEKGRDFVDLMWSCARNAPADWTVFEGKGCHL